VTRAATGSEERVATAGRRYPRCVLRIALLGGGRMGEALLAGLLDAGYEPDALSVAEIDPERRHQLEQRFADVRVAPSPAWAVAEADVVVVALKPLDVTAALEAAAPSLGDNTLVVSIAAGITIAELEAAAPGRPVVRAMPNTASLVRKGASAISAGTRAAETDLETAERLLGSVGIVVRVPEKLLDAVTGLSGSGPAYVFLLAESLIEGGVLNGLPRDVATALVHQTILGAGTLLVDGDEGAEALRAAVTSPGGTTAAGLRALERHSVRGALLEAVTAATERSRELGAR
jgi:pyrroline-5-carboxylate reductase